MSSDRFVSDCCLSQHNLPHNGWQFNFSSIVVGRKRGRALVAFVSLSLHFHTSLLLADNAEARLLGNWKPIVVLPNCLSKKIRLICSMIPRSQASGFSHLAAAPRRQQCLGLSKPLSPANTHKVHDMPANMYFSSLFAVYQTGIQSGNFSNRN